MDRQGHLDLESLERARRQAVEVAQAILSGSIGLIAGCRSLASLAHTLVDDACVDPDFVVFVAVESETDHLPLEDQRVHWEAAAFANKRHEIHAYESQAREEVANACRSVVTRFGGV
jgi:hypothetical protein